MTCDISEILRLPVNEQEEIANVMFRHLSSLPKEDNIVEEELDKYCAKIESIDYKGYTIDEIKEKMSNKR